MMTAPGRAQGGARESLPASPIDRCVPAVGDYTYFWWENGFPFYYACGKRTNNDRPQVICFQTGRFGLSLDAQKLQILHFGPIAQAISYEQAARHDAAALEALAPAELSLTIQSGARRYTCTSAAADQADAKEFPVRVIDSGRWFQRVDIQQLVFKDEAGNVADVKGRLEISAWPDRLNLLLEVIPNAEMEAGPIEITLRQGGKSFTGKAQGDGPAGVAQRASVAIMPVERVAAPDEPPAVEVLATDITARIPGAASPSAAAIQPVTAASSVPVRYDAEYGYYCLELPKQDDRDGYARVKLSLSNDSDGDRTVRLLFNQDVVSHNTGLTPILRDEAGHPTGIPVQISKNWHGRQTTIWAGNWLHAFTSVYLPAHSRLDCELTVAYAHWGTLPAASHAQLCLIGWGINGFWDQAAIGSWGESICYEPDRTQRRCMIDDIRPMMVYGMHGTQSKWAWTNNVGGGDFLVYLDANGVYQPPRATHISYLDYGPNLTRVVYSQTTADGRIACRVEVSSPRCDDMNRAIHRFRYDVLKPTPFSRLAFYQLGADHYLGHTVGKISRGDASGMKEEWDNQEPNDIGYLRSGIPCTGAEPWFSLHQAVRPEKTINPWANRGLVIRSWKARLGGKDAAPFAAIYNSGDYKQYGPVLELSAPPEVKELLPGDFVEAEVELLVVPQVAEEYYGPNENFRASLLTGADTWRPVLRQAAGNDLAVAVKKGRLVCRYPIQIEADDSGQAEFEVTGGVGYVPVTFSGLRQYRGMELWQDAGEGLRKVDQARLGNDFWQTGYDAASKTWQRTYNVGLDSPNDARRTVRFVLKRQAD
jgi:hypothetical protein